MRREINYDVGIFWDCLLVAKETKIIVIIDQPDFWSRYVKKLTQQKALRFWSNSFNFVLQIMLETFFYVNENLPTRNTSVSTRQHHVLKTMTNRT